MLSNVNHHLPQFLRQTHSPLSDLGVRRSLLLKPRGPSALFGLRETFAVRPTYGMHDVLSFPTRHCYPMSAPLATLHSKNHSFSLGFGRQRNHILKLMTKFKVKFTTEHHLHWRRRRITSKFTNLSHPQGTIVAGCTSLILPYIMTQKVLEGHACTCFSLVTYVIDKIMRVFVAAIHTSF